MAQLPPSDEELGLFADQHDPDFYLDGEKLSQSSNNVLKALGPEVVAPVTDFHPAQVHGACGSGSRQLSRGSAIAVGVPPGHQFPQQVPLHLRPGQLQVQDVAGGSGTRQLSRGSVTALGVPPGHQFHQVPLHLRPGQLQGFAVPSGPMRSPAPVVRRPPVADQSDQMQRTVHVSPIPLGFHDKIQLKLQMEQIFGVNTIEEFKLPIQHKGYGFVTFFAKETCDAAITRGTINLNLRQGPEADALSLKPARCQ